MNRSEYSKRDLCIGKNSILKALILGFLVSVFVNLASPYTESVGFSNFSWSYLPEGAAIPLLFILAVNLLLTKARRELALNRSELLLVLVMALVANSTSIWLIYFFLAAIVSPHYFATTENEWYDLLLPYLPEELIISDSDHAVRWFYEGVPQGSPIPWKSWLIPLGYWIPFFIALLLASYTLIIFFRKQWMAEEKLAYPIMQPIIHLAESKRFFWSSSLLWVGVAIPLFIATLDVTKHIYPGVPAFPVDHLGSLNWGAVSGSHGFSSLVGCINFVAVGVGYFVPQDVLLSIWLFYLIIKVGEVAILSHTGRWFLGSGGMFIWGDAGIAWQSFGAFVVFVALMVFRGRSQLREFINAAFRRGPSYTNEPMTPRTTISVFLVSISFMMLWLDYFQLPLKVVLIFMPLLLLIYLGVARVVCQSGIFYVVPPMIAQNPCIYLLSARRIGTQGMISLGLTYAWHGDVQSILSGLSAQSIKLQRAIGYTGKQLTIAILIAVLSGLFIAPLGVIVTGYKQGALNWSTWLFQGFGANTYNQVLGQIQSSAGQGFEWEISLYFAVGSIMMLITTILYYRFLWWHVHPIGLAVVSSFTLYAVYIGFFIAWAIKHLMLRWGGLQLYSKGTPFFIGLLIGHYTGRAIALITYTIFGLRFA